MKKPSLADLKTEANDVYEVYRARFAGQPRATREVSELEALITRLNALISDARTLMNGGTNPAVVTLIDTAQENLARYKEELREIRNAQENPYVIEGARLASRANRVFDAYARHFAGKDRGTRDLLLLVELVTELKEIRTEMNYVAEHGVKATEQDLQTVNTQIGVYETEQAEIERTRAMGTTEEQSSRLATLANLQFGLYNSHFAGKRRLSRRPELIQRMITNLEDYLRRMEQLQKDGYSSDVNKKNMDVVRQNLEMYRTEIIEIRKAREEVSLQDLAGVLGGSANDVMAEYRELYAGKDRKTRDLEKLSIMCDELRDIALQMNAIARTVDIDFNEKNFEIVTESRAMYESEYKEIKTVQTAS